MAIPERVHPVLVVSILFATISFLCVTARVITRSFIIRIFGIDDWLIIGSMAASIGFLIVEMHQIKYGLGLHIEDVPADDLMRFFQCLWATIPVYNLSLFLCKLSIILQYKRVFDIPIVQKICKIFLVVLALYGCWTVFGSIFMCVPVQFFWGVGEGSCMNKLAFWFSNAALNIATDIFIVSLPMPLIRKLQIPLRQKIVLMVVFAFGAFVCITSIIRLKSLLAISTSPDTTFDGVEIAIWSNIEINIAIICASVPALKPLVTKIFPKLLGSSFRSKDRSNAQYANGSHHMETLQSSNRAAKNDIYVRHEFEVREDGDDKNSREGSERNLVPWGNDQYSTDARPGPTKSRELV
ncbi:hypothetical protein GQ53DRAFT_744746 [Thozetella sp. PMI_491]|nr:hypothetical protein GQ53DRAFT_744746 [Thozetella sp. PMI_491]